MSDSLQVQELLIAIHTELKKINRKLDDIDSNTSGTESNVSGLEYKFDEIKNILEEKLDW